MNTNLLTLFLIHPQHFYSMNIFKITHVSIFIFVLLSTLSVQGQGCSDAGFCTLNGFKPGVPDSTLKEYKNHLSVGLSHGEADHAIAIWSTYIEYHRQVSDNVGVDLKLGALNQTDKHISTTGISDLYLNVSYACMKNTTVLGGFKIPLQDGNKQSAEGLSLPMDYQASLGTFDLILGLRYEIQKFTITAGLQQPLIQNNNHYLSERYPADAPFRNFQSTNNYTRSGDGLLRLTYPFKITRQLTISPSALSIYHFSEDRFSDINGMQQSIKGSRGLTFNGTVYVDYALNKKNNLNLNLGKPFITRKVRPDGLTREYIITLEYTLKF